MWLVLTRTNICDTVHAQWPIGYNSTDDSSLAVNIITQEQTSYNVQSWWRVRSHHKKFTTTVQGQKVNCQGHNVM